MIMIIATIDSQLVLLATQREEALFNAEGISICKN